MALKPATATRITVTAAGTPQQVSASDTLCTTIVFQADTANSGNIFVGDVSVSSTRALAKLTPGQFLAVSPDSFTELGEEFVLSDWYVDSSANGDKVYVSYLQRR